MARLAGQTDEPSLPKRIVRVGGPLDAGVGAKEYAERIGKYVPGEIVAAYTGANGILATVSPNESNTARTTAYVMTFIVCAVLTPIYYNSMAVPGQRKRVQLWVSSIAFVVWAYALGGVFAEFKVYFPWLGSLLLIFFSLISGAIKPSQSE